MGNSLLLDIYEFHNIDFIKQMESSHKKSVNLLAKKFYYYDFCSIFAVDGVLLLREPQNGKQFYSRC